MGMCRAVSRLGLVIGLMVLGWGVAVTASFAASQDEAKIQGELPRNTGGAIDLNRIREAVASRAAQGVREIQFRDFTLTSDETRTLFLALDRDQNLLRQIANAIPADGVERQVTLRGFVDGQRVEGRVQRQADGTLRMRLEGGHDR